MQFIGPIPPDLQTQCPIFISSLCALPISDNVADVSLVTIVAIAIIAIQSSEKVFGQDKPIFYKEVATGINKLSYFLGKLTSHIPSTIVLPFVFLSVWYTFVSPRQNFGVYLLIFFLIFFCWVGFGYFITIFLDREHSLFFGTIFILLCAVLSGANPVLQLYKNNPYTLPIISLSPNRWALELMYLSEISVYKNSGTNVYTGVGKYGFNFYQIWLDVFMLVLLGIFYRFLGFIIIYLRDPRVLTWLKYFTRTFWRKTNRKVKKK